MKVKGSHPESTIKSQGGMLNGQGPAGGADKGAAGPWGEGSEKIRLCNVILSGQNKHQQF